MKYILYDNYDLFDDLKEAALEDIIDNNPDLEAENITEDDIQVAINYIDEDNWNYAKECIENVFMDYNHFIAIGSLGLWNGKHKAGKIVDSLGELLSLFKDCHYIKIWDEDGRLFIAGSHHDGNNMFEIKMLNDKGYQVYQNWLYNNDKRSEEEIHQTLFKTNFYTSLPHICERM